MTFQREMIVGGSGKGRKGGRRNKTLNTEIIFDSSTRVPSAPLIPMLLPCEVEVGRYR